METMRNRIQKHIQGWDAIVDHRTGTHGDNLTAQWLSDELRSAGTEPVIENFDFRRRVLHECYVSCADNYAKGVPLFDGGYTDANGVQGLLSHIDQSQGIGLTPFAPTPGHPSTQRLEQARRDNVHQAIVAVASGELVRPGLSLLNADHYTKPYGPPVLQVATEHQAWLENAQRAHERIKLVAHASIEQTQASNVQATIRGSNTRLAPLVIMTPRSAWWTCTSERAGGIALWLECAQHFATHRPERTVHLTANTGHELGHVGLDRYLLSNPKLVSQAHAWVHLGANFAAQDSDLLFQASTPELMQAGLTALSKQGINSPTLTPVGELPLGEARNIHDGNGQYISLLGNNPLFHHPDDRWPHAVDLEKTLALNQAMLSIVDQLANR